MEAAWLKLEGSASGSCQISPGLGMGARPPREQPWIVSELVAAFEARAKCHNFCEIISRCLLPSRGTPGYPLRSEGQGGNAFLRGLQNLPGRLGEDWWRRAARRVTKAVTLQGTGTGRIA